MRFIKISIENFCSIDAMEFDLADQGLVVVSGKNEDTETASSNGSGKSTAVVDSICWALFGQTSKGGTADSVLPGGNGKGARVAVEFQIGKDTYSVARHRKHKTNASKTIILKNGEDISKATAADNDKQLAEILGISFDTFLYTTILGQGLMFRFSQLTDQNRKEILESVAGSAVYENARIAAREDAKKYSDQARTLDSLLVQTQNSLNQAGSMWKSIFESSANASQQYHNAIAAIDYDISTTQQQLDAVEANLAILNMENSAPAAETIKMFKDTEDRALTSMLEASSAVNEARSRVQRATTALSLLGGVGALCDRCGSQITETHLASEHALRSQELEDAQKDYQEKVSKHQAAQTIQGQIAAQLRELQQKEQAYNLNKQSAENSHRSLTARIAELEKSKSRVTQPDFSESLAKAEKACTDYATKIAEFKEQLVKVNSEKDAAEFWVSGFQDIRVASIDNLLSFLNARLEHYCKILCGDDLKVSLSHNDKGKIDMIVSSAGGTYLSLSGGEKDRADIVTAFALHDLASQCTNWHSNLLVLDEIAVFVDETGIDRLMKLVSEKLDRVDTCFMISHNPIFAGYGDSSICIVKKGGKSRLETA